ncbi:MAG: hypothetical protein LBC18_08390 [Opitutaceae bacterium]|jgi:prefoldin subunit 5|nr:hypothetical protein [Opitutaceae bacterium]
MMDIEVAKVWLQILNMVGTVIIGAWMYLEKRSNKTNERIDDLAGRFEELDKSLRAVKSESGGHLRYTDLDLLRKEQKGDLEKLYLRINTIDTKMSEMIGEARMQNDTLQLIMGCVTKKGLS